MLIPIAMTFINPCPCQSGLDYENCCGPYHTARQTPATAQALMRARYSAYALGQVDYIMNTTHRENPEYRKNLKAWRAELVSYCQQTRFLGLAVLADEPGETTVSVTFRAQLSQHGVSITLSEKSFFVKVGQRWLYHSGQPVLTLAEGPQPE